MSVDVVGIEKSFGTLRALAGVTMSVADGELHALLGANGSGKSTLSKCICGAYRPDAGRIRIGAVDVEAFAEPAAAAAAGVRVVHQDSPLVNSLSVSENFALVHGFPGTGRALGRVRWSRLRQATQAALDRHGVGVRADALAGTLRPGQRAMVALALALDEVDAQAELLVLDEVTASIPENEANDFLGIVRALPARGVPVLMVTHRFKEVAEFADRTTILSNGEVVHSGPSDAIDAAGLVAYMTVARPGARRASAGTEVRQSLDLAELRQVWGGAGRVGDAGRPALELDGVSGETLDNISLSVAPGEIVGVAGLPESGVHELPEILSGARRRTAGRVVVAGRDLPPAAGPSGAIAAGMATVPRDRHQDGGIMSLPVRENMTLPEASRFWRRRRHEREVVGAFMRAFDVRPQLPAALLGTLSGGNQQKVVVAKWLITRPLVLVLDDPTAGVDPAARQHLFAILEDAAAHGLGVLLFSTEPEQFVERCSRVLILGAGRIVAELHGDDLDAATINQQVTSLSSV